MTLRNWDQGATFSGPRHQEIVEAINERELTIADADVDLMKARYGSTFFPKGQIDVLDVRLGIIVSTGPSSAADFTGPMYWVKFAKITGDVTGNPALPVVDPPANDSHGNPSEPYPVPATNLAEARIVSGEIVGPHGMPTDGSMAVVVLKIFDQPAGSDAPAARWIMVAAPPGAVVVKLTSNSAYTGRYGGALLSGSSTDAGTGDLSMPDGLTVGGTDSVEVLNVDEDTGSTGAATNTHRLKLNTFAIGIQIGQTTESTPRPLIFIHGGVGETASPKVLGASGIGSTTADTTAWSRAADGLPCDFYFISRAVIDGSTNTVFEFMRKCSLDARGIPYAISAETKLNADTGTVCP